MMITIPTVNTVDPLLVTAEAVPSGDSPIGKVFSYQTSDGQMHLEHPRIAFGPSSLDTPSGPISLNGNQWNLLASAQIPDGFRYGLVAYIPSGRWGVHGHVAFASINPNTRFDIKITQGCTPDPNFPNMLTQNPVIVGGGVGTSPNTPWGIFSIPFSAPDIQNYCARGQAGEIAVWVFPQCAGSAGGAMNVVQPSAAGGGVPVSHVSKLTAMRWNGFN